MLVQSSKQLFDRSLSGDPHILCKFNGSSDCSLTSGGKDLGLSPRMAKQQLGFGSVMAKVRTSML